MKIPLLSLSLILSFLLSACSQDDEYYEEIPFQEIVILGSGSDVSLGAFSGQPFPIPPTSPEPIVPPQLPESTGIPDPECSGAMLIESDVRGTSMLPLYENGDMIQYSSGYYQCHDVKRDDIIIYHHPRELLIKRVVGVPGDNWKYLSGQIIMGKKPLQNTEGQVYSIDSKILRLYADSYPTIPRGTYLILGNQVGGSLDSSKFGLISQQDIVGKVISREEKKSGK